MKISKNSTLITALILTVVLTYNIIFFVICGFSDHTATFWISWVFRLLSFSTLALTWFVLGKSGLSMRDWLFGLPIINHSTIYIISEFILSTVFYVLEDTVGGAWAFAAQFLIFAVYLVFAISCFLSKSVIDQVDERIANNTQFIKSLRIDTEILYQKCDDAVLKIEIKKLAETAKYSDPVSSEDLCAIESELQHTVDECSIKLSEKDYYAATELCKKAYSLLLERNLNCKRFKK